MPADTKRYYARCLIPCKDCGDIVEASSNRPRVCFKCKTKKNLKNYHERMKKKKYGTTRH